MNLTRGFLVLGAALALLVGVLCLFPGTRRWLGLDLWSLPDLGLQLQQEGANEIEPDRESKRNLRRVTAKFLAAQDVREGRLTLWQATVCFRTLEADEPALNRRMLAQTYPAATEDERCCREVIAWVAVQERTEPEGEHGVSRRLAAELEDALRRGPLSLPDPAPAALPDLEGIPP
jgi:hypothetical protein